jgi:hypothetical protein
MGGNGSGLIKVAYYFDTCLKNHEQNKLGKPVSGSRFETKIPEK